MLCNLKVARRFYHVTLEAWTLAPMVKKLLAINITLYYSSRQIIMGSVSPCGWYKPVIISDMNRKWDTINFKLRYRCFILLTQISFSSHLSFIFLENKPSKVLNSIFHRSSYYEIKAFSISYVGNNSYMVISCGQFHIQLLQNYFLILHVKQPPFDNQNWFLRM